MINNQKGFSLIELMIALSINLIVIVSVYDLFLSFHKRYLIQEETAEIQQNIRIGMDMMSREIQMAGYDPTGSAFNNKLTIDGLQARRFIEATPTKIHFLIDINGDGNFIDSKNSSDENEDITYELKKGITILRRKSGKSTPQPVAEDIRRLEISYFDYNGNKLITPIGDLSLINRIRILLKGDINQKENNKERELVTSLWLRNQ